MIVATLHTFQCLYSRQMRHNTHRWHPHSHLLDHQHLVENILEQSTIAAMALVVDLHSSNPDPLYSLSMPAPGLVQQKRPHSQLLSGTCESAQGSVAEPAASSQDFCQSGWPKQNVHGYIWPWCRAVRWRWWLKRAPEILTEVTVVVSDKNSTEEQSQQKIIWTGPRSSNI